MKKLFLSNNTFAVLKEEEAQYFLSILSSSGLDYVLDEEENIQLFPQLKETFFILKPLKEYREFYSFAERLHSLLRRNGAAVMLNAHAWVNASLANLPIMQLAFNVYSRNAALTRKQEQIRFYYSLKHKDTNLRLLSYLIREISTKNAALNIVVPSYQQHLFCLKYRKTIMGDVPTIIVEFSSFSFLEEIEELLSTSLAESIIKCWGTYVNTQHLAKLEEFLKLTKKAFEPQVLLEHNITEDEKVEEEKVEDKKVEDENVEEVKMEEEEVEEEKIDQKKPDEEKVVLHTSQVAAQIPTAAPVQQNLGQLPLKRKKKLNPLAAPEGAPAFRFPREYITTNPNQSNFANSILDVNPLTSRIISSFNTQAEEVLSHNKEKNIKKSITAVKDLAKILES
ncbi:hypothetical protein RDV78_04235 [Bacillota bacterium LX-D]|nr:hypothetical protein [Bacillota bacterium LX-D]